MENENLQKAAEEQAEIIKKLDARRAELEEQLQGLQTTVAHLQKDSRNFSKSLICNSKFKDTKNKRQ